MATFCCCPPPCHCQPPMTLPTDSIVITQNHSNNILLLFLLSLLFLLLWVSEACRSRRPRTCATFVAPPLDRIMISATTSSTTTTVNTGSTTTTSNTTNNNNNGRSSSSSRPSSSSSSSQPTATQACAACKYQRRKCIPDCTLAPYFPANQQQKFLNAHRLFGVSNILKIIRNLDPYQSAEAMKTIIYQSDMRALDPVGGCYRIIRDLESQIERDSAELALVLRQLAVCRAQAAAQAIAPGMPTVAPDLEVNPNLLLNTVADDVSDVIYGGNIFPPMSQQQDQHQYYNYFCYDGGGISKDQNNDPNDSINSNSINNNNHNVNNDLLSLQHQHQQCMVEDDDVNVKPLVDMFDVRQTLIEVEQEEDSKNNAGEVGSLHCSTQLELKDESDPVEHVQEHDLKGAASLFTLTNCSSSPL